MNYPPRHLVKCCSLASFVGVLVFVLLVLVLHVLNPQMNPVRVPISAYVTGYAGFLMTLAFLARALGELLLVAALALGTTRRSRSRTGLVLLTWAALCSFLVALVPGLIAAFVAGGFHNASLLALHSVSALLGFTSLALAALFWSSRLRQDPRWRSSASVSLLLGLLVFLSLIGFLALPKSIAGLTERGLEVCSVCWLGFVAWRLFAQNGESVERASHPARAPTSGRKGKT
jgi:hypothetical protein